MSIDRLLNAMKRASSDIASSHAQPRFATIESVDPSGYSVKVTIQPEGTLTGWLPLGAAAVGNACIVAPPAPGDQVQITPIEGDAEHWVITARVFSAVALPPTSPATGQPVQPGEVGIFTPGAWLHLSGGNIYGAGGALNWTGAVDVTGNVAISTGASGTFTTNGGQVVTVQDGIVTNIY